MTHKAKAKHASSFVRTIIAVVVMFEAPSLAELPTTTRLKGTYSSQGPIVIEATRGPVALRGLDFFAEFGAMSGSSNPGPFSSISHNDRSRWSVESDADVLLDGELRLDATMVPPTPLNGVTMSGTMTDSTGTFSFHMDSRRKLDALVSYPFNGGPVAIRSDSSLTGIRIDARAEDLQVGNDATPFDRIVESTPTSWSVESDALIDFTWRRWKPDLNIVPLDATLTATASQATAMLTDGLDSITVGITRDEPVPGGLIGGYSMFGGPVFLKTTDGPESISTVTLNAHPDNGKLIGTENPGPFDRVLTNTPTEWSVDSDVEVMLDGVLQLDLEVERNAFLVGETSNATSTEKITFNGFTDRVLDFGYIFVAYPEQGGNVMLLSQDQSHTAGIDIVAKTEGVLTQGDDPSPFTFFLTAPGGKQSTFGLLGSSVEVDDVVELDLFVSAGPADRLVSAAGGGGTPVSLPIVAIPHIEAPATCMIPDPEVVGDLDGNGTVEFVDFLVLSLNYGEEVDTYAEGDTNCNGVVDFDDFLRMGNNFGGSTPKDVSNVPEPNATGWLLVLLAFISVQCRGGRAHAI